MANFDINKVVMESIETVLGEETDKNYGAQAQDRGVRVANKMAAASRDRQQRDEINQSGNKFQSGTQEDKAAGSTPRTNVSSSVNPDAHGDAAPKGKLASALSKVREKFDDAKEKAGEVAGKAKQALDDAPTAAKYLGGGALAIGGGLAAGKGALALRNRLRKSKK